MLCVPLAATAAEPPWIEASDRNSAIVIEMEGAFHPEFASELGVDRFDTAVLDLDPENAKRYDAAAGRVLELLSARRKTESDAKVRQDLDILIDAVESRRRTSALEQSRFHDLVIAQGLLPPKLLEHAVMQEIERMR